LKFDEHWHVCKSKSQRNDYGQGQSNVMKCQTSNCHLRYYDVEKGQLLESEELLEVKTGGAAEVDFPAKGSTRGRLRARRSEVSPKG